MKTGLKIGKVSSGFNRDPKTVVSWMEQPGIEQYFTDDALGRLGQRVFSRQDVNVLNTIRICLGQGADWKEIEAKLNAGEFDTELPPAFLTVEQNAPIMQYTQLSEVRVQLQQVEKERDRLAARLEESEQGRGEDRKRIEELIRELGKKEGQIEILREMLDK